MGPLFKYPHVVLFLSAYALSEFAVTLLIRLSKRVGAIDVPGLQDYKVQKEAVPFLGGFGLFIGYFGALAMSLKWSVLQAQGAETFLQDKETKTAIAVLGGGAAMAIMGLVDDFRPINAFVKLLVLCGAVLLLMNFGLVIEFPEYDILKFAVTLFWIVGVISAFNAIDNTDGVSGLTALSVAAFTFMIAWGQHAADAQAGLSFLAIALAGATLGFLRHNRPPAKVYLGNSGAFALGFLVAVMPISGRWAEMSTGRNASWPLLFAPVLLLAYPLFDLCYTVFLRWKKGIVRTPLEAVIVSGRDHTAHRLSAKGYGRWKVLFVIGLMNAIGGGAALLMLQIEMPFVANIGVIVSVIVAYLIFGATIWNAVDLRSKDARISNRKPTTRVLPRDREAHKTTREVRS